MTPVAPPDDVTELLRRVRRVEWVARRAVDANTSGGWHSRFRGRGMSFSESRAYQAGDDPRTIDWLATARQGDLYVKQFVEERELTTLLCLDVSASMRTGHRQRRILAAEACAVLALSALQNQDRVGLLCFSDRVERYVKPNKGRGHVLRLVRDMLVTQAAPERGTNVAMAMRAALQSNKKRAVVVLVTDLLGALPEQELMLVNRRHELVVLHLRDRSDDDLPNVGLVRIIDPESGVRALVDSGDARVRAAYRLATQVGMNQKIDRLRQLGIPRIGIATDGADATAPIVRFLRGGAA
jgi:uncharacterized protein (DUF58 family)